MPAPLWALGPEGDGGGHLPDSKPYLAGSGSGVRSDSGSKSTSGSESESRLRAEPEYRAEGFFLLVWEAKFQKRMHSCTFLCAYVCVRVPVCLVVEDPSTKSCGQVIVSFRCQRHRDHQASHRFTQMLGTGKKNVENYEKKV